MGVKIEFNLKAFDQLRTAPGVDADLDRRARAVAAAAGDGYEVLPSQPGRKRARRLVAPVTRRAKRDNERNNTLIRSLSAGK